MNVPRHPPGPPLRRGGDVVRDANAAPQVAPAVDEPMAALLTPRGRGAVASVRLRGPVDLLDGTNHRLFEAANGKLLTAQQIDRVLFGHWGSGPGEEVVVCRAATDVTEIHCHGGDAAARRILSDLERTGCRIVTWQEFDSASNGLFDAECREALAHAPTLRAAAFLLDQVSGTLRTALENTLDDLRNSDGQSATSRITALLEWAEFGLHLTQPWQVVILGRPNVGKSSLLNALAGYVRAIVFDEPGTTRDVVTAEIALNGWPVTVIDTAGIRQAGSALEAAGIDLARDRAQHADLRLLVLDVSQPPQADDLDLLATWPDAFLVANKSDLPDAWGEKLPAGAHLVSTLTGEGVEPLAEILGNRLVPNVPAAGSAIPVTARQVELLQIARDATCQGEWSECRAAIEKILQPEFCSE